MLLWTMYKNGILKNVLMELVGWETPGLQAAYIIFAQQNVNCT